MLLAGELGLCKRILRGNEPTYTADDSAVIGPEAPHAGDLKNAGQNACIEQIMARG